VHMVALYFWLNFGLLGLGAYLALQAAALAMAWYVWRRANDRVRRAIGLGVMASLGGLILAELTASFTGVEYRFSIFEPIVLGLLAAFYLDARAESGARRTFARQH
jgi:hypothetical protein